MINKILFVLAVIIAFAYAGFSIYIADTLTKSAHTPLSKTPDTIASENENIVFKTQDRLTLRGWLFPNNNAKNLIIFVPGFNLNRVNEDYGTVSIAKVALQKGYAVLMYDPRGTGESAGNRNGFGSLEWVDVVAAISFAKSKGYSQQNIALIGNSQGAITILSAADKLENVGAIVADSAATKMEPFVERGIADRHIPSIFYPGIFFFAKTFFDIDVASVRPIDTVKNVPNRIFLFLHGAKDSLIPVANSKELLKNSNPKSTLVIFPGARHVQTFKTNSKLYNTSVFDFLDSQLK